MKWQLNGTFGYKVLSPKARYRFADVSIISNLLTIYVKNFRGIGLYVIQHEFPNGFLNGWVTAVNIGWWTKLN